MELSFKLDTEQELPESTPFDKQLVSYQMFS